VVGVLVGDEEVWTRCFYFHRRCFLVHFVEVQWTTKRALLIYDV
jgi:hypothetical protein